MLRKKLAIDYWTNEEFTNLDAHEITKYTLYLTGFAKILIQQNFDELRELISSIQNNQPKLLTLSPEEIPETDQVLLPFILLIKNRYNIRAVAASLHILYTFDRLPEEYISDKRIPLPASSNFLNEETYEFFLITPCSELRNLKKLKQLLCSYYLFSNISPAFFDLPLSKSPLPSTLQELTL